MSGKMAKRQRMNIKLMYIIAFTEWLTGEPPMWKIWEWAAWKRSRPSVHVVKHKGKNLLLSFGSYKVHMPRFKDL